VLASRLDSGPPGRHRQLTFAPWNGGVKRAYRGCVVAEDSVPPVFRASDADRDNVLDILRRNSVEGRLSYDTFLHRVELALSARGDAELAALLRDLPSQPRPDQSVAVALTALPGPLPGGLAALAGARLLGLPAIPLLTAVHPVVAGLSVMLWAFGTWPPGCRCATSLACGAWPSRSACTAVASETLGRTLRVPWLVSVGHDGTWAALAVWTVLFAAMVATLARGVLPGRAYSSTPT